MRRRSMPLAAMRILALLFLLLAVAYAPTTSASATEQTAIRSRASLEVSVVRELNAVRSSHGLPPIRASRELRAAARSHTRSMLEVGFFGHESTDGRPFSDRIRRFYTSRGWRSWSVGETLLVSQGEETAAQEVVSSWLDSPPHRAIVLSPVWRDVGIGAFYAASAPRDFGGAQALVVTADFGLRSGKVAGR